MRTWQFFLAAMAAISLMGWAAPAAAQPSRTIDLHPERLAAHCIESIQRMADECVEHNAQTVHRCLPVIRRLLEQGREDAARRVARQCIQHIHRHSQDCVDRIQQRCRRCVELLLQLGEEELARRVHEACGDAIEEVRHAEHRAVHAIRSLFGDDEP